MATPSSSSNSSSSPGSSSWRPAAPSDAVLPVNAGVSPETFCTSGTSPTVHLVGPGQVGCALLELLEGQPFRLVAVTDSTATILKRDWLNARSIVQHKRNGGRIADLPGAEVVRTEVAVDVVDADVVVDVTPTRVGDTADSQAIVEAALRRGARVALAGKAALCGNIDRWLDPKVRARIGIDAVLGGAGASLRDQLDEIRAETASASFCGSASTTLILETVESGGTLEEGLERAAAAGCLEPDPELDLTGADAAVKLAILIGALTKSPVDPQSIVRPDLREVDLEEVRRRAAGGSYTTRLVGRYDVVRGVSSLVFETLEKTDPLVAPPDRVVYAYDADGDGPRRVHVGDGVGGFGTARAVLRDLHRLCEVAGGAA